MTEETPNLVKKAIVVGINEYNEENGNKIPALTGAVNDAEDLYERLTDPEIGGFTQSHKLIGQNATSIRIRQAISQVFYKPEQCDLAVFYFSGHGIEDDYHVGYLAPYDISISEPLINGIRMSEPIQIVEEAVKSGHVSAGLVILDCCYSGIALRPTKGGTSTPTVKFEDRVKEYVLPEGKFVLASSGEEQESKEVSLFDHHDGQGPHAHGLFTSYLLEGIDGNASDDYGIISLNNLNTYVAKKLKEANLQMPGSDSTLRGDLGSWIIAKSPKKYNEKIEGQISQAKYLFEQQQKDYLCTIVAASTIREVLQVKPNIPEALNLNESITKTLNEYQDRARTWLFNNRMPICLKAPYITEDLRRLSYKDVNEVIKLNVDEQALLCSLWMIATDKEKILNNFINDCRIYTDSQMGPKRVMQGTSKIMSSAAPQTPIV